MAGLYIHIPFCKRICSYCDFYKSTMVGLIPEYIAALTKELEIRKEYLDNEVIDTVYIGGGTPSLLTIGDLESLLAQIYGLYKISGECEITLEANPDDLSHDYLAGLAGTPVNRLSIGVQSFIDRDLKFLKRRHDAAQALASIQNARNAGFSNISIDLIYGIPGMSARDWQSNLEAIPEVEHISAYHLTIEPGTALARRVSQGLLALAPEEESTAQYYLLKEFVRSRQFIHYEISNLAKNGFYSRHNTGYWQRRKYLGAGPSAHSYDRKSRQWNIRDVGKYIKAIQTGSEYVEKEILSNNDLYNEYLMVSLRTCWGADRNILTPEFGPEIESRFLSDIAPYISSGHIIQDGSVYKMTDKGWLISDYIISRLMVLS